MLFGRLAYSEIIVATMTTKQSAGEGERAGQVLGLSGVRGPVLRREHHEHPAENDGDHPEGEHHVRRAHDLHVEPVGVVPPVVERGGSDHHEGAPDGDPRAERPRNPQKRTDSARSRVASRRRWSAAPASRSSRPRRWRRTVPQVRQGPERVPADGLVPGDVPENAHDDGGGGEQNCRERPGEG